MKKQYSIDEILRIVWKNIVVIIVFAIVGAVGLGGIAKMKKTTTYSAQRNIVISHNLNDSSVEYKNSQLKADLGMIPTYSELVNDQQIMKKAHKLLPKKIRKLYSASELKKIVSEDSKPNSLVITIRATASEPEAATSIVNVTAQAVKNELPKMQDGVGNIQLLSKAPKLSAESKTTPSIKKYAVLGFALGALVGMVIAFGVTTWKKII